MPGRRVALLDIFHLHVVLYQRGQCAISFLSRVSSEPMPLWQFLTDARRSIRSLLQTQETAACVLRYDRTGSAGQPTHLRVRIPRRTIAIQPFRALHATSRGCICEPRVPRRPRPLLHRAPRHIPRHSHHLWWTWPRCLTDRAHPRLDRARPWCCADDVLRAAVQDVRPEKTIHVLYRVNDPRVREFPDYKYDGENMGAVVSWGVASFDPAAVVATPDVYCV
jgi:hypothetical protein